MSDDLVEMARLAQRDERMSTGALYGDLADRIEELEAKLEVANLFRDLLIKSVAQQWDKMERISKEWEAAVYGDSISSFGETLNRIIEGEDRG